MRTYKLKISSSENLDAFNAVSASVWNECLKLKEMWDYAHGYRTTSKACELWMDKMLSNRNYTCKCGFQYHRDGVGAINIRKKYLDRLGDPVVADMAPPVGFRSEVKRYSA